MLILFLLLLVFGFVNRWMFVVMGSVLLIGCRRMFLVSRFVVRLLLVLVLWVLSLLVCIMFLGLMLLRRCCGIRRR